MTPAADSPFIIVTGADSGFYQLLQGLILSIRAQAQGRDIAIGVLDLGLTTDQLAWLQQHTDRIVKPRSYMELPAAIRGQPRYESRTIRPFLPRYFPDFEFYLWLDADTWVQDWSGIEQYLNGVKKSSLAIAEQVHRDYVQGLGAVMYRYWRFEVGFGSAVAKRLVQLPHLNSGCVAIKHDAPHWQAWADNLQILINNTNPKTYSRIADQIPLNYALRTGNLPFKVLPAIHNWQCHLALPTWDENEHCLCEPSQPNGKLSVLHLTGRTKDERLFNLATTADSRRQMALRYFDRAAGQV